MNETLQEKGETKPLWSLAESLKDSQDDLYKLNVFSRKFVEARSKYYRALPTLDDKTEHIDA